MHFLFKYIENCAWFAFVLSYWGHLVTARFGACGNEKNRMSCIIAASAPTNDLAQIRYCTLWVCKQPDYAMHSRFKQLKFSLDIPQVHSGHFAIYFWTYGYRSLPYVSSSQSSSKICKKISIIGFDIAQKSSRFQNQKW